MSSSKIIQIKIFCYLLIFLFTINVCQKSIAKENKIIFKINNNAFTTIDYEARIKYLDFVGNNENLNTEIILNDFISANIFYEYYKNLKQKNKYDQKIIDIFENILKTNSKNNKIYSYELDKESIFNNIKIDLIRKEILESILNRNFNQFSNLNSEIDLLYKFEIKYINLEKKNDELIDIIDMLDVKSFENIISLLEEKKINYFIKKKEVKFIESLNKKIKDNIYLNKNFFILENSNNISIIFINKTFETYEGLIADIYSVRSKNEIKKENLKCQYLMNLNNNKNIQNEEYKFSKLNNEIKNNLITVNDFIKYFKEDEYIYIVLCNIKFDKNILNNFNINKLIDENVTKIERNFINKYSKIYNLIRNNA